MQNNTMAKMAMAAADVNMSELARRINQSPQNLGLKFKRDTLTRSELEQIAAALGAEYHAFFVFPDGTKIE